MSVKYQPFCLITWGHSFGDHKAVTKCQEPGIKKIISAKYESHIKYFKSISFWKEVKCLDVDISHLFIKNIVY